MTPAVPGAVSEPPGAAEPGALDIEIDVAAPLHSHPFPPPEASASRSRPDGLRRPSRPDRAEVSGPPSPRSGVYGSRSRVAAPVSEAAVQRSLDRLIASGRPDAAAQVARAAGRHAEAAAWFEEARDGVNAGLSHAEAGADPEAIAALVQVAFEHPQHRAACRAVARCAARLGALDPDAREFLGPYVDSGPRSDQEIGSFLDLAELLWQLGDRRRAQRCLQGVLRLDPDNAAAQLMKLTWAATEPEAGSR